MTIVLTLQKLNLQKPKIIQITDLRITDLVQRLKKNMAIDIVQFRHSYSFFPVQNL